MGDWKRNLIAVGFGMLGVACALGLWHAYTDHQALHALINLVNANAQRNAKPD